MKIIKKKVSELIPYINNPRKNDEAVDKVASSIKNYGFKVPIVIDKNNEIITGHTRLKAAKKLQLSEVPCIVASDLTPAQIKAYRIADNKVSEQSEWDFDILKNEILELKELDFEIENTGFDIDEIDELFPIDYTDKDEVEDEVPEVNKTPFIKRGDVIKLGNHRFMCGDSTSKEDVERMMSGEVADMAHNDPPYGMKKEKNGVLNDNLNFKDLLKFNKDWINIQLENLTEVGSWYCWGIDEPLMDIYSEILKPLISENKMTFRNLLTWDKGNGQGQTSHKFRMYPIADEKCLFVMKGVQGFNNNSDNYYSEWDNIRLYLKNEADKVGLDNKKLKEITGVGMYSHWFTKSQWLLIPEEHYKKLQNYYNEAFQKEYEALKKEYEALKKEYYATRSYFDNTHDNQNNVWHFNRCKERVGGHATPKPVALCERAIKSSCRKEGIVIDGFLGSGSTLIACEKTGRHCRGMEFDEHYCDVIIKRWLDYTGQQTVEVNGKEVYNEFTSHIEGGKDE